MSTVSAVPPLSTPAAVLARQRPLGRGRRRRTAPFSALTVLIGLVWLFPVYWMVSSSFKDNYDLLSPTPQIIPSPFTFNGYREAFQSGFLQHLENSLIVTLTVVAFSMALSLGAALAVARYRFRGRATLLVLLIGIQMIPFGGLLIPIFIYLDKVGLYGELVGLIIAYIAPILPFTIWMLRGFIAAVPAEVEEAALTDGCSRFSAFMKVVFPLIAPGLVATSIFGFIQAWNEFVYAYILLPNGSTYTIPVWLDSFIVPQGQIHWNTVFAGATLFTLPVLVFFLIIQRRLMAGMTAGAVKG
jgi:N,N'-diacetylchitobiose transport system permease protein